MKPKIEGCWIAWHPEEGIREISLSAAGCREKLTGVKVGDYGTFEEYIATSESEMNYLAERGWQLKPVCLVLPALLDWVEKAKRFIEFDLNDCLGSWREEEPKTLLADLAKIQGEGE